MFFYLRNFIVLISVKDDPALTAHPCSVEESVVHVDPLQQQPPDQLIVECELEEQEGEIILVKQEKSDFPSL